MLVPADSRFTAPEDMPEKEYLIPFVVLNEENIHDENVQRLLVR